MNRRSAFARAETFLDFSAGWKWTARSVAVATALCTLALFVVLALFTDLMLSGDSPTTRIELAGWNPWSWQPPTNETDRFVALSVLTVVALVIAVIRAGLLNLMSYAAASATLDAATRLRRALYHHTYRLGTLTLREGTGDDSVTAFAEKVDDVHDALYQRLTTTFAAPLTLVLLAVVALLVDVWVALAWILLAALVVLLGGYLAARHRDRARFEARQAAKQLAFMREGLSLRRMVKANLMELFNQTRVERQLAEHAAAGFRRFRSESLFTPLLLFLGMIAVIIGLYIGGWAVINGRTGPGRLIVLAAVLATAYWPLHAILSARRVIRKGRESAVPVMEFLDRPAEIGQVLGAEFLPGVERGIEFRSVSLREPGSGKLLLNDMSLRIKAGQRVALVGPNEAEKHSVAYLLLRFLDPTTGEIVIDHKSLRGLTLESVRAQFGLVLWDNLVFNDTVANNIGCGDPSVTLPQIIEAAKRAHAHHFIQRLPYGYETPIGDLGTSLRRSQKFRIALARAILKDPSVFIIEEPLTPFDDENKGLIDDTMAAILPGKTVIFLAHRISTIRSCDVVYLIHRGQVEAAGPHKDLISANDLYKHLHYMEFNEFAKA